MYQYTDKYEAKPLKTLLLVLGIVAALVVCSVIFGALEQATQMGFFNLFPYLIGAGMLYLLYKRVIEEFCYTLLDDTLVVERSTGKRAKPVVTVPLKSILALESVSGREKADYRCALPGSAVQCRLVFLKEQRQQVLLFAPDTRMRQQLEKRLETIRNQAQEEEKTDGEEN
jgi:hypothetical protein